MLYIIGGAAKSGKTTLRKRILEEKKISGISTDFLRAMFQKNPDIGVSYKNDPETNSRNISIYLDGFIEELINFSDEDFVIEGDLVDEGVFQRFSDREKIEFIFMGYPDLSLKEKVSITKEKEVLNKSWVNDFLEDEVQNILSRGLKKSKELKLFCSMKNITYINTSWDFNKKIDEFIKEI